MKNNNDVSKYAQMGMAALIPGMQYMLDQMQEQLNEFREALATAQGKKKLGRPLGSGKRASGWPADPDERRAEMLRRMQVAAGKAKPVTKKSTEYVGSPNHPRHPDHPEHAKWLAKMKRSQRKAWDALTPAQRKERLAKMVAGRPNLKAAA